MAAGITTCRYRPQPRAPSVRPARTRRGETCRAAAVVASAVATAIPNARRNRLCNAASGNFPETVRCASLCATVAGEGRFRDETAPVADSSHHTASTTATATRLGQIRRITRLASDNLPHLL